MAARHILIKNKLEISKEVIRNRQSKKDREYNDQKKQNTTQKTKD